MAHKIQVKRGNKADLPTLDAGEFGLCQDTNELFIGNNGNKKIFPAETPEISDVVGLQSALDGKVDDSQVLTNVPANAKFTDTITTINGKTGAIAKADITALGIPAQDTVYTHPATHSADMIVDGTTNKAYTATEKNKLAGIAAGANKTTIANNLTETVSGKALDATQGKVLADLVSNSSGVKTARFVIGTSTAGWTAADCDYLCDGTADQTEINAAITALPATGGEIVILDGTYNITAKIDITKDNVSIRGNGNATILNRMYNSSVKEGVITLTSRSGCKIANLQVEGNKTSYNNNFNYGIYLDASSNNNTITGNTCNNNNRDGIHLDASSNNTVTGNTCNNSRYGIYLSSSSNNTITGNTCNNNNSSGISLSSSSNNTITGNTCNNNNSYSYGIYLSSSSNNNTITGNTCNNNSRYGIYLDASSNNTVTGNTCNNNNCGIFLNSSNNNTVTGNTCIRGTGLTTDYTASQYTIRLIGTGNNYNLIAMNNCMGKAVTNEGGTGNTLVNNKFDEA